MIGESRSHSHSWHPERLQAITIVSPAGMYRERILKGIMAYLSMVGPNTEASVVLLINGGWIDDKLYQDHLGVLSKALKSEELMRSFRKYECSTVTLDFKNQLEVSKWLVEAAAGFFRRHPRNASFFVDLTAGPRRWLTAALAASSLFDNVFFYHVNAEHSRTPDDFPQRECEDVGTVAEIFFSSKLDHALSKWVQQSTLTARKSRENVQYKFFRGLYDRSCARTGGEAKDPQAILISQDELIEEMLKAKEYRNHSSALKGAKKYLNEVKHLDLFGQSGTHLHFTWKGMSLARGLFESEKA